MDGGAGATTGGYDNQYAVTWKSVLASVRDNSITGGLSLSEIRIVWYYPGRFYCLRLPKDVSNALMLVD